MKNFQEKEIKDLQEVVGGANESWEISNEIAPNEKGEITIKLDFRWVSKK